MILADEPVSPSREAAASLGGGQEVMLMRATRKAERHTWAADAEDSVPAAGPDWRPLYRIGGVAAALMAPLVVLHARVFFASGLPETAADWFAPFQRGPLLGLLAFELLM